MRGEENFDPKPVFFLDTGGSDWVKPMFDRAGVELHTAKTRGFADLLAAIPEAEAHGSVLIVDSLTHFWVELCEAYSARKATEYNLTTYRLQFQDWGFRKTEWRKFTDRFVNSSLHTILCGRAGYEYDYEIDEDTNKKRLENTGIKMPSPATGSTSRRISIGAKEHGRQGCRLSDVGHRGRIKPLRRANPSRQEPFINSMNGGAPGHACRRMETKTFMEGAIYW